jgi:DNA-binding NtrC family response regulator
VAIQGKRAHILLVDHDRSLLEAVGTILRGRDHQVHTAADVRDALALFEKHEFDVVVADLQVSNGSNGDGLLEWLSQHKPALSRKLIWMCAVAPSSVADDRVLRNGSRILQKPFQSDDLLSIVDELLLDRVNAAPVER